MQFGLTVDLQLTGPSKVTQYYYFMYCSFSSLDHFYTHCNKLSCASNVQASFVQFVSAVCANC